MLYLTIFLVTISLFKNKLPIKSYMKFKAVLASIIWAILFLFTLFTPLQAVSFAGGQSAIAKPATSHASIEAQAYILEPGDGEILPETFIVKFGLSGIDLAPAGVEQENTGHHHLLIDQPELPDLTASLPATDKIRHFGKAQTETELTLSPGEHTLQLVLGNYLHIPHDNPVISDPISITVK